MEYILVPAVIDLRDDFFIFFYELGKFARRKEDMRMKGAKAIVRCLEEEGVDIVFGYPGAAVIPLYEELRQCNIQHILMRHEQATVHAANGYARITGKVGVCVVTSGPGATNAITGVATAYMDSIPLVIITGQVNRHMIGHDVFQEVDITGATEPFVKHSYLVKEASDLPRIFKEAFYIAASGRPGPVLIDIPLDVQEEKVFFSYPETVSIRGYCPTFHGHPGQLKRAIRRLQVAERPLVCVGGGVLAAGAEKELRQFIEKAKIPLVHTFMGIGAFPTESPYSLGMIGSHGHYAANRAVSKADVVLFIGARIADRATGGNPHFAKNADIIHVDIDPAEIGKNIGALIPVVGDAKEVLRIFVEKTNPLQIEEWQVKCKEWKEKTPYPEPTESKINPKYAIRRLSKILDSDAVVVADVGQNQMWAARHFEIKGERKFFSSGGLGTMGYSLPAAIGTKIGAPEKNVVAVVGDGGFQMSLPELGTLQQTKVKLIILLFNNQRLGMVREIQDRRYQAPFGVYLDKNPDFIKLAEAYGLAGRQVSTYEELEETFIEALDSKTTFLIECIVDEKESTL